jgi:hypothetical protein
MKIKILAVILLIAGAFFACKKIQTPKVNFSSNANAKKIQEDVLAFKELPYEKRVELANGLLFYKGKVVGSKDIVKIYESISKENEIKLYLILTQGTKFKIINNDGSDYLIYDKSNSFAPCGWFIIGRNQVNRDGNYESGNCRYYPDLLCWRYIPCPW